MDILAIAESYVRRGLSVHVALGDDELHGTAELHRHAGSELDVGGLVEGKAREAGDEIDRCPTLKQPVSCRDGPNSLVFFGAGGEHKLHVRPRCMHRGHAQ